MYRFAHLYMVEGVTGKDILKVIPTSWTNLNDPRHISK